MERGEAAGAKPGSGSEGPGEEALHIVQVETVRQFPKWLPPKYVKQEPEEGLLSQSWETQWQDFLKAVQSAPSGMGSAQVPGPVPWEDAKTSLVSAEEPADTSQQATEEQAQLLESPQDPAEQTYDPLDSRDERDSGKAKEESERSLSTEKERQRFRRFCYKEAEGPREAYSQLRKLCHQWLKPEKQTKEQILEVLILEQFLTILPQEMQKRVKESGPETCTQAVALAEEFLLSQQAAKRQRKEVLGLIKEGSVNFLEAEQTSSELAQRWLIREVKRQSGKDADVPGGDGWVSDRDGEPRGTLLKRTHHLELGESFVDQGESKQEEGREEWRGSTIAGQGDSVCEKTLQRKIHKGKGRSLCTLCGKSFSTKSSFNRHQRIHTGEKPYKCPDCSESFLARSNLIRHQRIHTGEKPYKCSDCGKRFSRSANLITHRRSHTGEKPYKCSGCGKMFNQSAHLMRHQRTHVRDKPYECMDYGKGFAQGAALTGHQRIHTGEKPYGCSDCSMKFRDKSCLNRHQRRHTVEKPYKCTDCWKGFSRRSVLIRHQKTHMGENSYKCLDCDKNFLGISDFVAHQNTHTGEETV
ncbi:zinc finger and SCAN domain-containing protein 30-like [Hemicordylus capensis]|uniref:zinc finger and SCAN domain-containing protein 30-like n=1 Tax=Hemicordylus capensis TaxID=884348 RepID=UPI00230380C0|nr:zinc finger and SCAN domain-containing protein 30-like [Hemicordylus capensis]XP_053146233.1 zinc finger and SCAN domain-containing protein 30-like [Hemicordylus capensis]